MKRTSKLGPKIFSNGIQLLGRHEGTFSSFTHSAPLSRHFPTPSSLHTSTRPPAGPANLAIPAEFRSRKNSFNKLPKQRILNYFEHVLQGAHGVVRRLPLAPPIPLTGLNQHRPHPRPMRARARYHAFRL